MVKHLLISLFIVSLALSTSLEEKLIERGAKELQLISGSRALLGDHLLAGNSSAAREIITTVDKHRSPDSSWLKPTERARISVLEAPENLLDPPFLKDSLHIPFTLESLANRWQGVSKPPKYELSRLDKVGNQVITKEIDTLLTTNLTDEQRAFLSIIKEFDLGRMQYGYDWSFQADGLTGDSLISRIGGINDSVRAFKDAYGNSELLPLLQYNGFFQQRHSGSGIRTGLGYALQTLPDGIEETFPESDALSFYCDFYLLNVALKLDITSQINQKSETYFEIEDYAYSPGAQTQTTTISIGAGYLLAPREWFNVTPYAAIAPMTTRAKAGVDVDTMQELPTNMGGRIGAAMDFLPTLKAKDESPLRKGTYLTLRIDGGVELREYRAYGEDIVPGLYCSFTAGLSLMGAGRSFDLDE